MAVAHDASSKASAWTNNVASFSWTHTPSGAPKAVVVFVMTGSDADLITSVTYGGEAMTQVAEALDSAGEPGRCTGFFLGANVPTGAQTVLVTRTNSSVYMWGACATATASANTAAVGSVTLDNEGTISQQNIDDGSPGTNSLRYAGLYWGDDGTIPAQGTNSTNLQSQGNLLASRGGRMVRETTAGQGARPVGFTSGVSDDRAAVHFAVKELAHAGAAAIVFTVTNAVVAQNPIKAGHVALIETVSSVLAGSHTGMGQVNLIETVDRIVTGRKNLTGAVALTETITYIANSGWRAVREQTFSASATGTRHRYAQVASPFAVGRVVVGTSHQHASLSLGLSVSRSAFGGTVIGAVIHGDLLVFSGTDIIRA